MAKSIPYLINIQNLRNTKKIIIINTTTTTTGKQKTVCCENETEATNRI
jgi:hypothetical protein